MATCVHAEQLAIDHMCDPREGIPVSRIKRGERPSDSCEGNTAIHHWVVLDKCFVIERDELMPHHLRINRQRHACKTEKDEEISPPEHCSVPERYSSSSAR